MNRYHVTVFLHCDSVELRLRVGLGNFRTDGRVVDLCNDLVGLDVGADSNMKLLHYARKLRPNPDFCPDL